MVIVLSIPHSCVVNDNNVQSLNMTLKIFKFKFKLSISGTHMTWGCGRKKLLLLSSVSMEPTSPLAIDGNRIFGILAIMIFET